MKGVEDAGFFPTGEYLQLNSYENRVFDVRLEKELSPVSLGGRVIVKFYRPGRWNLLAIQEEHHFLNELQSNGIAVVAPLRLSGNSTIEIFEEMFVSFFPKVMGRIPQELNNEDFKKIGRTLARIHNVGQRIQSRHRPRLSTQNMGWPALAILKNWVVPELWSRYNTAATTILQWLEGAMSEVSQFLIHGDCHRGNLLLKENLHDATEFIFLDFDDCCWGPAVQDFWMLFSGDPEKLGEEELAILSGYDELRDFDDSELFLIPGLRGLRIIHYAGWIARRWQDPTFPQLFPAFQDFNYWAQEVEALEKIAWSL